MLEYVKIAFIDIEVQRLFDLPELEFKTEISEKTGEVSSKSIAKYHFCKITVRKNSLVEFSGSIHKLWNSLHNIKAPNYKPLTKEQIQNGIKDQYKGFNGNQFTTQNILEVKKHLGNLFDCHYKQMIFENAEYGINGTTIFNPRLFIKGVLYHNGKQFEFKHDKNYAEAKHQRYYLKIYNKSKQYGMTENTLRVEIKIIKTEDVKHIGIKTFDDVNEHTLSKAYELLMKRFNEVVYYDKTISKKSLSPRQNRTLDRYSNQDHWLDELTPKNRDYHKKQLSNFIAKYSSNLRQQIEGDIKEKFVIINRLSESENNYEIESKNEIKRQCYFRSKNHTNKKDEFVIINRSSIGLYITNDTSKREEVKKVKNNEVKAPEYRDRKCLITGLDISMQKESSILLSHTGLKHHSKTNKKEFENIKNKHLSKKWIEADFKTQIKELAHNIRNKYNNVKTGSRKRQSKTQTQMFE